MIQELLNRAEQRGYLTFDDVLEALEEDTDDLNSIESILYELDELGIDLQKEVHEDMKANFSLYPKTWGLKTTDKNIDHRRVPNLEVFFARKGKTLPITQNPNDYKTGDLVTWLLAGDAIPHIGIVTHIKSNNGNPMIVHNVGSGQVLEDCLLSWKIVGHFRYGK